VGVTVQERLEKSLQKLERVIYDSLSKLEAENTALRTEIIALKNDLKRSALNTIKQPLLEPHMMENQALDSVDYANNHTRKKASLVTEELPDLASSNSSDASLIPDEQAELKESLRKLKKRVS
jgi:hypothetical protein